LLLTSFLLPRLRLLARERGPNYHYIYDRLSLVRAWPQNEQLGVLGLRFRELPMTRGSSVVDPIPSESSA